MRKTLGRKPGLGSKPKSVDPADSKLPLSPSQLRVYKHLRDAIDSTGSVPTFREIARAMKWKAVGSVQTVVRALIDKGWIEKTEHKARGFRLVGQTGMRLAPILGSAPAGPPLEAFESHDSDIAIPEFIRGPVFAVRVQGDSMEDAGIENGDLVIVRQSERAETGEIIVAMIDGEVTIKRLHRTKGEVWLQPENSRYKPKKIESENFRVLGTVIGLHRYWE